LTRVALAVCWQEPRTLYWQRLPGRRAISSHYRVLVKPTEGEVTMNEMMGGEMMWGMGLWELLVIILLVLGVVALVKYVFSRR
jgi:hypothetical protein